MTKLLDRICELRDILEQKKYNELGRARMLCDSLFKEPTTTYYRRINPEFVPILDRVLNALKKHKQ